MDRGLNFKKRDRQTLRPDLGAPQRARSRPIVTERKQPPKTEDDKLHRLYREQKQLLAEAKQREALERKRRAERRQKLKKSLVGRIKGVKDNGLDGVHFVKTKALERKRATIIISILVFAVILPFALALSRRTDSKKPSEVNDVKGVAVESSIVHEKPSFDLLYPAGQKAESFDTVKISPAGNDPVYTYLDTYQKVQIKVSQQLLPKAFEGKIDEQLEKLAKDFQATNVIQVDDVKVYHGYSEGMKVQSLVFVKQGLLVFITSPSRLADEQWAGYVSTLNKQQR